MKKGFVLLKVVSIIAMWLCLETFVHAQVDYGELNNSFVGHKVYPSIKIAVTGNVAWISYGSPSFNGKKFVLTVIGQVGDVSYYAEDDTGNIPTLPKLDSATFLPSGKALAIDKVYGDDMRCVIDLLDAEGETKVIYRVEMILGGKTQNGSTRNALNLLSSYFPKDKTIQDERARVEEKTRDRISGISTTPKVNPRKGDPSYESTITFIRKYLLLFTFNEKPVFLTSSDGCVLQDNNHPENPANVLNLPLYDIYSTGVRCTSEGCNGFGDWVLTINTKNHGVITLQTNQESTAERMEKAINHASQLCEQPPTQNREPF